MHPHFLRFSLLLNFLLVAAFLTSWIRSSATSSLLAVPFPLNDPRATYKVEMVDGARNYVVSAYFHNALRARLYVRRSSVELAPYVGRTARISGRWPRYLSDYPAFEASTQCVRNACHDLFPNSGGSAVGVVDIDGLTPTLVTR